MNTEQRAAYRRSEVLSLKRALERDLTEAEGAEEEACVGTLFAGATERKSNRDILIKVDNMLRAGCGFGVSTFVPKVSAKALPEGAVRYFAPMAHPETGNMERRSCIAFPDGTRQVEVPRMLVGSTLVRPTLHLCADQGSVGMSCYLYMLLGIGCRMTLVPDLFHRLHNDMLGAVAEAGLSMVRAECFIPARMRRGPFDKQGNHAVLKGASQEMGRVLAVDNPLFEMLYDDLVAESEELRTLPEPGSREHMEATFEYLKEKARSVGAGCDARTSRWWAWEETARQCAKRRWADLFVLLWLGRQRKWWTSWNDSPLRKRSMKQDDCEQALPGDAEQHLPGNGANDRDEGGVNRSKVSLAASREEVRRQRRKCTSTLQYCCQLMLNDLRCRLWFAMGHLTTPLETFFKGAMTSVKTHRGTRDLIMSLCERRLDGVVLEQLQWVSSEAFAETLVASTPSVFPRPKYLLQQDAQVLNAMWNYTINLCGNISLTSLAWQAPPLAFLRLLSSDDIERTVALGDFERAWGALQKAEAAALTDAAVASLVRDNTVGLQQFNREIFIQLAEADFKTIPEFVRQALDEFSATWFSSLIAECGFNEARRVCARSRNQRMELQRIYHTLSVGTSLMEDFGRKVMPITQAARCAASSGKLSSTTFGVQHSECSLSMEILDKLQSKTPTWPTLSAHSLQLAPASWKMLVDCDGDASKMKMAWLSLLVTPGTIVLHTDRRHSLLVMSTTPYGFTGWRTPVAADLSMQIGPIAKQSCRFHVVEDHKKWRVTECSFAAKQPVLGGLRGFPRMDRGGSGLLQHSCRTGFRNMTVPYMKRLLFEVVATDWEGPRPNTEATVLAALCRQIMGDAADEAFVSAAMRARHFVAGAPEGSVEQTNSGESAKEVLEDLEAGVSDDEDVHRQLAEVKENLALAMKRQAQHTAEIQRAVREMRPASASSAGEASSASGAPRPRRFVPMPPQGPSQEEAQALLPPLYRVSKDDRRENRWRIRGPGLGGEKSRSFGRASGRTEWQAFGCLFLLAWQAHQRHTGEACPYDLEGLEDV